MPNEVALLIGVGLGTLTWYSTFSAAVSLARRRVRLLAALDVTAGAGVMVFGGLLAYRSLNEH